MYSHRHLRQYIGQHVRCHTHYGAFEGVIMHCTKDYVILAPAAGIRGGDEHLPQAAGLGSLPGPADGRPFPMGGPGGPMGGPGGPMGPSGGPGWGGGGWHFAIPLAAILGITAVGMHWW